MELPRSTGVLLHITSLPSSYGIGDMGPAAYRFIDTLAQAGVKYWQVLPIGPTTGSMGHSPYASPSTFAGNPLIISPELVAGQEWFTGTVPHIDSPDPSFVDFESIVRHRESFFRQAFDQFNENADDAKRQALGEFRHYHHAWLEDYALFTALAHHFGTLRWQEWPSDIASRDEGALARWGGELAEDIQRHIFIQFLFFSQWQALRARCRDHGIELIGDIPIYVTLEGADSWSFREVLEIDPITGQPDRIAGVPPDYFSATGQRWGNPLYRWYDDHLRGEVLRWWTMRIAHLTSLVDILRIDHFRAFESYWAIVASEETAVNGEWITGPGYEFFEFIKKELGQLPLIAEDLGIITPEVEALRDSLGLPGMKIMQFAFDGGNDNYYLPHNIHHSNCLLYTGTHDNNTSNGWFYEDEIDEKTQKYIMEYLDISEFDDFHRHFIKETMKSVANLVILPVQDILGYGKQFRMNTPGTAEGNWRWRLRSDAWQKSDTDELARWNRIYRRGHGDQEDTDEQREEKQHGN